MPEVETPRRTSPLFLLSIIAWVVACHVDGRSQGDAATAVAVASGVPSAPEVLTRRTDVAASDAGALADGPAVVTDSLTREPGVMDNHFRVSVAAQLVSQVRRGEWAAFIPKDGIVVHHDACISLMDGSLQPASETRECFEVDLEGSDYANRLGFLADDLQRVGGSPDAGWRCEKMQCTLNDGEMGFSGTLTFAREGGAVRLLKVKTTCGGALSDTTIKKLGQAKAARPAHACPKLDTSCAKELGLMAAKELAAHCTQVSEATAPPCHQSNPCALIRTEIKRSCLLLKTDRPAYCDIP